MISRPGRLIRSRVLACGGVALLAGAVTVAQEEAASAAAAGTGSRFSRIPTRNVFGSKPPPPPPTQEAPPEPPKERPDFFLTGFTRKDGQARAFIAYQPKGKPMEYPEPLLVGVEVDGIKLLGVDADTESVRIEYNGEELTLDFDKNGMKASAGGAPGVPGGMPAIQPNSPKGAIPPPPVPAFGNQLNMQAPSTPGVFGNVGGSGGPTVVGRGGAVLGGFNANGNVPAAALNGGLPAIQAGGGGAATGTFVPAVQPGVSEFGGTVQPANPARRPREVPPAPFPSLPGQ